MTTNNFVGPVVPHFAIEPNAGFRTGENYGLDYQLRAEFAQSSVEQIDAPDYIPSGSVRLLTFPRFSICAIYTHRLGLSA